MAKKVRPGRPRDNKKRAQREKKWERKKAEFRLKIARDRSRKLAREIGARWDGTKD